MTNKGIVINVEGDLLTVVFDRPEACGECHNCMHGSADCAKHTITLRGKAEKGDIVEVEIDDSNVVAMSATAYLIPLAGFLGGLFIGWLLRGTATAINSELLMALCAVLGTAAAYALMRVLDSRLGRGRWEPRIVSVSKPMTGA